MRRGIRSFFLEQRRLVEANLEKVRKLRPSITKSNDPLVDSILFPLSQEQLRLAELAKPLVEQAILAGAAFGSEGLDMLDFDVLNPLVGQAVAERVAFFSRRINEETAKALTSQIRQGLELGESIAQIADRIEEVYDQALGYRSLRIARTEALSASNKGALLSYEAGGATEKRWVTAGDEHVRETHRRANGQVRGVHQKFEVGSAQLEHPGDPGGPAEEIINCRCTTEPIVRRS
jgi:SPP1 gp7 family putative phage head morphogenesis protein